MSKRRARAAMAEPLAAAALGGRAAQSWRGKVARRVVLHRERRPCFFLVLRASAGFHAKAALHGRRFVPKLSRHISCFWGGIMRPSETEVLVIDAPQRAALALKAYRPRHERTHLICRWPDELMPAFARRVAERLSAIRRGAEVAALTLVLGSDPSFSRLVTELGDELAAAIAPTGSLTLMGIGASQTDVVSWFEVLRGKVDPSVTVGASFPTIDAPGSLSWEPPSSRSERSVPMSASAADSGA